MRLDWLKNFRKRKRGIYVTCGKYMQQKRPLDSEVLQTLSEIDPPALGHSVSETPEKTT